MKKLVFGAIFFLIVSFSPALTIAAVDISIGISLPPLIVFHAPPNVIVLPDTDDVYVVPEMNIDIFFWNGWWWRPWEGRWYRSHYYDRGWVYYNAVPSFYFDVDPGWRRYYINRNWYGHPWRYERIPNQRLQKNWKTWHDNRYWERKKTWGIRNYQPRTQQQRYDLRYQRQKQFQQRPEIQRQQQHKQEPRYQHKEQYPQKPEVQRPQQHQQQQELKHQQQEQYQQKQEIQRQQQKHEPKHQQQEQYEQRPEFQRPQQQRQEQQERGQHPQPQRKYKGED